MSEENPFGETEKPVVQKPVHFGALWERVNADGDSYFYGKVKIGGKDHAFVVYDNLNKDPENKEHAKFPDKLIYPYIPKTKK